MPTWIAPKLPPPAKTNAVFAVSSCVDADKVSSPESQHVAWSDPRHFGKSIAKGHTLRIIKNKCCGASGGITRAPIPEFASYCGDL
jgi:hypothetical protein